MIYISFAVMVSVGFLCVTVLFLSNQPWAAVAILFAMGGLSVKEYKK